MEYNKKIIPNPLNNSGFINNNYKNENFATSDLDGEESSYKYRKANLTSDNSIVSLSMIPDEMYLPGIGELGIALENITYINSRILTYYSEYYSNPPYEELFPMNTKYMSGTPYSDINIINSEYQTNSNIDNIWVVDLEQAYITNSSIKEQYKIMPMYKYNPEDTVFEENNLNNIDDIPEETSYTYIEPKDNDDEKYIDPSYFCNNLPYQFGSYIYNYRNNISLDNISTSYIKYSEIEDTAYLDIWKIPNTQKNLTFNHIHTAQPDNPLPTASNINISSSLSITETTDAPRQYWQDNSQNPPVRYWETITHYYVKNASKYYNCDVTLKYYAQYDPRNHGQGPEITRTVGVSCNSQALIGSGTFYQTGTDGGVYNSYTMGIQTTPTITGHTIAQTLILPGEIGHRDYNYLIDFCIILPNFNYIDAGGNIITVGVTKTTNPGNTINIYDTTIEIEFVGLGKTAKFYPKLNSGMDSCVIFTTNDIINIPSSSLENNAERLMVNIKMTYNYLNISFEMFSKKYYFDIYDLYGSGRQYGDYRKDDVFINFLKINNHKSNNSYIIYNNLPQNINLGVHISETQGQINNIIENITIDLNNCKISNEYPGIRVNNLQQKYISSYSYSGFAYTEPPYLKDGVNWQYGTYHGLISGFGITYITGFYNNGLGNLEDSPGNIEKYYDFGDERKPIHGNIDIEIPSYQYHWTLRTFNQKDEYGIYNDCILNHINMDINILDNNRYNIDNQEIYIDHNLSYYPHAKIYNLPICGAKQYITANFVNFGESTKKYRSLLDTHYLFIVNINKTKDRIILFDDRSHMLCRNKTSIRLTKGEMKLYYPMQSDIIYNIKLSKGTNDNENYSFEIIDLYDLALGGNSIPGQDNIYKLLNIIATLYHLYETQENKDFTITNYFTKLYYSWGISSLGSASSNSNDCYIQFEKHMTLNRKAYLVIIE